MSEKERIFNCPSCGAAIQILPGKNSMYCSFCGQSIADVAKIVEEQAALDLKKQEMEAVRDHAKEMNDLELEHQKKMEANKALWFSLRTALKILVPVLVVIAIAIGIKLWVDSKNQNKYHAVSSTAYQTTDNDGNFIPIILDERNLLTESEEKQLYEEMKKICDYCVPIFWTTEAEGGETTTFNKTKRVLEIDETHYLEGIMVEINMYTKNVTIFASGKVYEVINKDVINEILNQTTWKANYSDYYSCAKETFQEIFSRLKENGTKWV